MNNDFPKRIMHTPINTVIQDSVGVFANTMETSTDKKSSLGVYSGYTFCDYDGFRRYSRYVQVRDGTRIAVDWYIPMKNGTETSEPLPVIWTFTPYGRVRKNEDGNPVLGSLESDLVRGGYIVAAADCRGTGASFGIRNVSNSSFERTDGRDVNEWLATQPWCNGKVGMFGGSYVGQTVLSTLSEQPEHLKCAVIVCTDYNKYDGWVRGGIPRAFGSNPDVDYREALNSVPVDEDPNGELLKQAVEQHRFNGLLIPLFKRLLYRDSYSVEADGEYWNMVSASSCKQQINNTGCAVYLFGGLYDAFRRDTFIMYQNMNVPKKLTVGPWYHCGDDGLDSAAEYRRFFDYWLKDIDNGIAAESPIQIYTQFASDAKPWRQYNNWPLLKTPNLSLFPADEGLISTCSPEGEIGSDHYIIRTDINVGVESPSTEELDAKSLCYTGKPLEKDLEISGFPMASLYVSAACDDFDLFITLVDVATDGETFPFSDGHLRASMRKTENAPYDFCALPWHPCREADIMPIPKDRPLHLEIDMMPTSYVLRAGHRLRMDISCAMRGFYTVSCDGDQITLMRNALYPSCLMLPCPQC